MDEERLTRALDALLQQLTRLERPVATRLKPGLTESELAALEAKLPFPLTGELRALYQWRNGTHLDPAAVIDESWLLPGYCFPPLEDAIGDYEDQEGEDDWRPTWFPFLANGAGDFFVVDCPQSSAVAAPVTAFLFGEPDSEVAYLDVTHMIETLVACFADGAFFVDDGGSLEMDDEGHARLAAQHNPGVEAWQR